MMYDQQRSASKPAYGGQQQQQPRAGGGAAGGSGRAPIPLRPVTIRMILDAQRIGEGALTISGNEVGLVTVVGRVLDVIVTGDQQSNTAKSHTYRITDGTGVITVKHWLDQTASAVSQEVGAFIFATGNVKVFQEKPILTGSIRVCNDQNEVTYHLLDSINVHLRMTRGDRQAPGSKAAGGASPGARAPMPSAAATMPAYGATAPAAAAAPNVDIFEQTVHRALVGCDRTRGMSADEIHQRVLQTIPSATAVQVRAELSKQVELGYYMADATSGRFTY